MRHMPVNSCSIPGATCNLSYDLPPVPWALRRVTVGLLKGGLRLFQRVMGVSRGAAGIDRGFQSCVNSEGCYR
jgi:hypothetical protein